MPLLQGEEVDAKYWWCPSITLRPRYLSNQNSSFQCHASLFLYAVSLLDSSIPSYL